MSSGGAWKQNPPTLFGDTMLPDKNEWAKEFLGSERFKKITRCVEDIPDPEFIAVWDVAAPYRPISMKHNLYMRRVLPLTTFYVLDFIDKQTKGGSIVNLCYKKNYFTGMYNIQTRSGSKKFYDPDSYGIDKLHLQSNKYKNAICVCEDSETNLQTLESTLKSFSDTIIYSSNQGYGYITFDYFLLLKRTNEQFILDNELNKQYKMYLFLDSIIERFSNYVEIIHYESVLGENEDECNSIDGDIRILFKVKPSTEV